MDSVEVSVVASPFGNLAPLYEVDPDADVLLIVSSSSRSFAPWDEPHHTNGVNGINGVNGVNGFGKANGINGTHATHGINGVNGVHKTIAAAPASRPGLRIKVSSKHLTLASRVFRNKLQFASTKATRQADGRVHLKLAEGFDPKAVSIVMNVLHGRGSKVPRAVDLDTLAQIALFVDRFQLLDAVDIYAERWIAALSSPLPDQYNRSLILWIYTSHVFRRSDIFKAVSKTAAAHAQGPLQTLGLPIRDKITKHIDGQRQTLLATALTLVHDTLDDLTNPARTAPCPSHHCDTLVVGGLVQALSRQRLVWPRPAKPFAGVSFESVVAGVNGGLGLHREKMTVLLKAKEKEEAWFTNSVPAGTTVPKTTAVANGNVDEANEEGTRPGWGIVGGIFPVTPPGSPQPVYRNGHRCDARSVVWRLDGLERLREGVEGLLLESGLGYQLY